MSKLGRILETVTRPVPLVGKGFAKWSTNYDNYCSLREVKRLCTDSGLKVVDTRGGTIGLPWIFFYFGIGRLLERRARPLLRGYFRSARFFEDRLGALWPFKYFLDQIIVTAIKQGK